MSLFKSSIPGVVVNSLKKHTDSRGWLIEVYRNDELPEGFDPAAKAGVDLTLSGHTHGGQIGFNGKSAFEPLWPDGYLWGGYRRGASSLYTTAGFGDWFPFRLGCPSEAPLLVLKRSA